LHYKNAILLHISNIHLLNLTLCLFYRGAYSIFVLLFMPFSSFMHIFTHHYYYTFVPPTVRPTVPPTILGLLFATCHYPQKRHKKSPITGAGQTTKKPLFKGCLSHN
jgi:hypothetical protein